MIRRDFLKTSTFTLIGAGIGPVALFSARPARGGQSEYTKARFDVLVNQWFYVDDDAHPTLELVRVDAGPESLGIEQFTAIFRGPLDNDLGDSRHRLMTAAESPMELHLAPLDSDDSGQYFAAHFCIQLPLGYGACAPVV